MNEELTTKEVLQIIRKICEAHNTCNECQFGKLMSFDTLCGEACNVGMANHADEVIEICKKWKANHTPIEVEWVHVCRIIEDTGNSKRCVCEQEIDEDEILPFGAYDAIAERTLKEYMEKHEGKFFAVVERLCRMVVR